MNYSSCWMGVGRQDIRQKRAVRGAVRGAVAALSCAVLGCAGESGGWSEATFPQGAPTLLESPHMASVPPRSRTGCAGVVLAGRSPSVFAAWWEARTDRSAALMVSRSPDEGLSWEQPVVADGRDRSARGCDRIPPSIFADTSTDYLHLSYYLEPAEGSGVYFTHSMRASRLSAGGEGMFHAPVPVVFGDRPAYSSVAGRGDTVLVAFEDPNGKARRIAASFSTGSGHIFGRYFVLSPSSSEARLPRALIEHDSLVVRWMEKRRGEAESSLGRLGERRRAIPRGRDQ